MADAGLTPPVDAQPPDQRRERSDRPCPRPVLPSLLLELSPRYVREDRFCWVLGWSVVSQVSRPGATRPPATTVAPIRAWTVRVHDDFISWSTIGRPGRRRYANGRRNADGAHVTAIGAVLRGNPSTKKDLSLCEPASVIFNGTCHITEAQGNKLGAYSFRRDDQIP